MWVRAELPVRFRVQVPARCDLLAGLQLRRLTAGASRPGRSESGPDDARSRPITAGADLGPNGSGPDRYQLPIVASRPPRPTSRRRSGFYEGG